MFGISNAEYFAALKDDFVLTQVTEKFGIVRRHLESLEKERIYDLKNDEFFAFDPPRFAKGEGCAANHDMRGISLLVADRLFKNPSEPTPNLSQRDGFALWSREQSAEIA
ncbi:MAG TPA: hypothetical protein VK178_05785 [Opitutaceae bacterium]|nr:hypothetical protein [Opitutaceae bacterium]